MAAPNWQFIASDLSGNVVGPVRNAQSRTVQRVLSGASTAGFTIRADNPILANVLSGDLLIKAYRNGVLLFHGLMTSIEFSSDDPTNVPTIAVTATDASFRLVHRISGKSAAGTLFNGVDRLDITESLIDTANSEGETGIKVNSPHDNCGSNAVYIAGPYRYLSECLTELGQTLDGFDWRMDPIEYAAGKINQFTAAAAIGSNKAGVVFQYQGRGNARLPKFQRDWSNLANKAYHITATGPTDPSGVLNASDATSIAARGLYETLVDADLTNTALRNTLLSDTVAVRKTPRNIFSFQPEFDDGTGRVPVYGTDYQIGDTIRASLIYNGVTLIDGSVRVYKMQFDVDDNNRETLTPTLVDES